MAKVTRLVTTYYQEDIPETIEAFKTWEFSSGSTTGEDFKVFARNFKQYVRKGLTDGIELADFHSGHYDLSGFLKKGNRFVYFSTLDVRGPPGHWCKDILIRTAESLKDYTGGSNGWTTLENFHRDVERLFGSLPSDKQPTIF